MACLTRNLRPLHLSLRRIVKTCIRSEAASAKVNGRVINYLDNTDLEKHRHSRLSQHPESTQEGAEVEVPRDFRYVQPEFLPTTYPKRRDRICEMLEREDMYRRRTNIDLPEFYVGSIMAVTIADKLAAVRHNRFLGICIQRGGHGLRANFILRNVVDGQGVEIMYEMYNPLVQKIEVLRLEKRLDDELMYLRDAPLSFSTFPFNMDTVPLPKGSMVPVNQLKVKLNPRPWHERWERRDLKGVEEFVVPEKVMRKAQAVEAPWEKYDLMKQYRASINEVDTAAIMKEAFLRKQKQEANYRRARREPRKK